MSDTIHDPIGRLRDRLAGALPRAERLQCLLELAETLLLSEPAAAPAIARQALRLARTMNDEPGIARGMFAVANSYRMIGRYSQAILWLQKTLAYQERFPDDLRRRGRIMGAIGMCYYMTENDEGILEYFSVALELSRQADDKAGMIAALNALGETIMFQGKYAEGIEMQLEALALGEELRNPWAMAVALKNLGKGYMLIKDLPAALDAHGRSLELNRSINNKVGEGGTMIYIGEILFMMGEPEKALAYHREALDILRRAGNRLNECRALLSIGRIHMAKSRPEEALDYLRQSLRIAREIGSAGQSIIAQYNIAILLADREDYREALALLDEALAASRLISARGCESEIHKILADIHERMGDLQQSIICYKRHIHLEQQIAGPDVIRKVERVRARYSLEQANREKSRLARRARQLESDLEKTSVELRSASRRLAQEQKTIAKLKNDVLPFTHAMGSDGAMLAQFLLERIESSAATEDEWEAFDEHFQRIYPSYIPALLERHAALSRTELKVCMLLRVKLSSKEIARIIHLSSHTIDTHRRRIRKKMGLDEDRSLTAYLAAIASE